MGQTIRVTLERNDMRTSKEPVNPWPDIAYAGWRETLATFQLWTQVAGKVRLTGSESLLARASADRACGGYLVGADAAMAAAV